MLSNKFLRFFTAMYFRELYGTSLTFENTGKDAYTLTLVLKKLLTLYFKKMYKV